MTMTADWRERLAAGRLSEAARSARQAREDADLVAALDDLAAVEGALRDKRYAAARRSLARYGSLLGEVERAGELRPWVDAERLGAAIGELEGVERARIVEPEALREHLATAFALPATEPEAHNVLGVLHALREEADLARAQFDRTLELDPGHYRALTNIGNLLLERGDAPGAEEYYRRALALNAEYPGAHHNLAVALRRQKKLAPSVRAMRQGQRLLVKQTNKDGREEARERLAEMGKGTLGRLGGGRAAPDRRDPLRPGAFNLTRMLLIGGAVVLALPILRSCAGAG